MKRIIWFAVIWIVTPVIMLQEALAQSPSTNDLSAFAPAPKTLLNTYENQLEKRSVTVFYDRLGPPAMLDWNTAYLSHGYDIHKMYIDAGQGSMERSFLYSSRETVTHLQVFDRMKDWSDYWNNFLVGSIGNTAEGGLNTLSPTPTAAKDSLWNKMMKFDGNTQFGFRPFDGDPYIYASSRLGHWHDEPAAYSLFRFHYDPIHFRPKIDGLVSINIPFRSQLSLGASFDPTLLGSSRSDLGISASWNRMFGNRIIKGYTFANITVDSNGDQTIRGGLNFPF